MTLASPTAAQAPLRLEASVSGRELRLVFETRPDALYTIEYSESVATPGWTTLTTVAGDGQVHSVIDEVEASQRFYRIRSSRIAAEQTEGVSK